MAQKYTAFTIKSNKGVFREIKIPMTVSISTDETLIYKTKVVSSEVMALWDTGATQSGISKQLANLLNLKPIGMTELMTAGGLVNDVNVYKIDFSLAIKTQLDYGEHVFLDVENDFRFHNIEVTEIPDSGLFDFLVGMDVICRGDFSITSRNNCSCVSFRLPPNPLKTIDYVKDLRATTKNKNREKRLRKKR